MGFNKQIVTKDFGYLIPTPNDPAASPANEPTTWQEAIVELSTDWERYSRMSKNAKDNYNNHFSFDKNKEFWKKTICKRNFSS